MTETEQDFSDELEAWLESDQPKTIGALEEVFADRSFAVAIMMTMFLSALPIPTGGITHVLEVFTLLIALGLVFGRQKIWLPKRFRTRDLGKFASKGIPVIIRRIRFFERFSQPRLARLFGQQWFRSVLGLVVIAFTLGALVAPPFSGLDTLPALGVVVVALSIVLRDIVVLAIGCIIGSGGIVLIITLGAAAARLFQRLF